MGKMVGNEQAKRNVSVIVATVFFAIFSVLAMIIGVVDILDPPFPYAQRLPIIGHIALIVGVLSLIATGLLWKLKLLGAYLGIVSFVIAYIVNVYVGEFPTAHAVAGAIVGLVLLIPLTFCWKRLS